MSDVLVKNMKMPKGCYKNYSFCPFCMTDITGGKIFCSQTGKSANYTCRPKSCPLIEVKPHGDLIDRSLLLGACYEMARIKDMDGALEVIENAPTVLGANNE